MYACMYLLLIVPTADPEPPAHEPHRRSSSMKVTGTTYRSSVRGRSSDDLVIGTHLGMGRLYSSTMLYYPKYDIS